MVYEIYLNKAVKKNKKRTKKTHRKVSYMCGCEPWGFQALNKTPNSVGWLAEMGRYLKAFKNLEHLPERTGMVVWALWLHN